MFCHDIIFHFLLDELLVKNFQIIKVHNLIASEKRKGNDKVFGTVFYETSFRKIEKTVMNGAGTSLMEFEVVSHPPPSKNENFSFTRFFECQPFLEKFCFQSWFCACANRQTKSNCEKFLFQKHLATKERTKRQRERKR